MAQSEKEIIEGDMKLIGVTRRIWQKGNEDPSPGSMRSGPGRASARRFEPVRPGPLYPHLLLPLLHCFAPPTNYPSAMTSSMLLLCPTTCKFIINIISLF